MKLKLYFVKGKNKQPNNNNNKQINKNKTKQQNKLKLIQKLKIFRPELYIKFSNHSQI